MQAATSIEPTVEPEVFEVLRKNNAEAAFQTACEVVRKLSQDDFAPCGFA